MVERLDVAAADTVASSRERIKTPFAKIFVSDNPEKTYYHIAWWQDGQMQIGYSSTNLTFVKRWLRDEFEIETPAADVAPVVRCEGCVFSQSDGWVCGGTALMPQHRTFPNSFCSFGERKDGGADNAKSV